MTAHFCKSDAYGDGGATDQRAAFPQKTRTSDRKALIHGENHMPTLGTTPQERMGAKRPQILPKHLKSSASRE